MSRKGRGSSRGQVSRSRPVVTGLSQLALTPRAGLEARYAAVPPAAWPAPSPTMGARDMRLQPHHVKPRPRFYGKDGYHLGIELEVEAPSYEDRSKGLALSKRPAYCYAKL